MDDKLTCDCPIGRDTPLRAPHATQGKDPKRYCPIHQWVVIELAAYVAEWDERVKLAIISGDRLKVANAISWRGFR